VALHNRVFSTSEMWKSPTIPSWISGNGHGSFGWFIHLVDTYEASPTWYSGTIPRLFTAKSGKSVPAFGYITQAEIHK
jgi:hypothetical protein